MPIMDGWEFLEILKEETEDCKLKTKIFMLTSSMFASDKDKALKYDYVIDYVSKPLNPEQVYQIFDGVE